MEDIDKVVEAYTPKAYAIGFRLTGNRQEAWDLTQNAMIRVLKSHATYDDTYSVEQWLYQILRNLYIDRLRQEKRRREDSLDVEPRDGGRPAAETLPDGEAGPEGALDSADRAETVQRALGELPVELRMAVALVDLEGYSYEAASEVLDIPASTLGVRVFRGRKLLKAKLKTLEGI